MANGNPNAAEAWLDRNLPTCKSTFSSTLASSPSSSFRLRVLPVTLAIGAIVIAAMWYREEQLGLISMADRFGYPALLLVTSLGAILLKLRPGSLHAVMTAVFFTYLAHLLAVYYQEMANRLLYHEGSYYELIVVALWLPLGYVSSFVFFPQRLAVRTALGIYAAISLPQLVLLGVETDTVMRQVAFALLVSQPVYLAALWGVGMIKTQASGIHEFAMSMSEAATMDSLTGIANRRAMLLVLERVMQTQSWPERPLSLLMFDVDRFKSINDRYGHAVGDEVLIKLAQEASSHLRASDLLGRWGGEEFMILTLDQSAPLALQMAERLRAELERIAFPHVGTVTVSIGVTSYVPGEELEMFINRADDALYQAKERGRNRVEALFETAVTLSC
jgi:diguanylate cyclase (GGDEF)-like protein